MADPDFLKTHLSRAQMAVNEGRFDEVREACEKVFAKDPGNLSALWFYNQATKFTAGDPVFDRMKQFARNDALAAPLKSQLLFMIGKALDDLGRVEDAFSTIVEANQLKGIRVDDAMPDRMTNALIRAVETAPDIRLAPKGPRMVFVLGMPRSGTSITSQMLGAHPAITNMGERTALGAALSKKVEGQNPTLAFLAALSRDRLEDARDAYLEGLPGTGVIVDKMPENYWFAWAIPMMFPEAVIIHMTRPRLATCWSCFRNDFKDGHRYSYDWASLNAQYDRHEKLCALGAARAAGQWFGRRLEDLTADPETQLTPVLDRLGLTWDPACGKPETAGGTMATLSKWQVRQGLDPKIARGWRAYEPLIKARWG